MTQLVLIGIGAGAATALLFASVVTGSMISILLSVVAPLPILIAALGWSHWAGLIAALFASTGLAVVFGPTIFISFLLCVGLPAWGLGYLALLARPSGLPTPNDIEWYPIGNLVMWCGIISAVVVFGLINYGGEDSLRSALRGGFERMFKVKRFALNETELNRLIDFMVIVLPPTAAVFTTITNVLNLWLAGRIVTVSGRLRRPPPDIPAMQLPSYAPLLTGGALVGSLLPGMVGKAALTVAAALLMIYALLGFAVLHHVTRGMNARMLMLGGAYVSVMVLGWPILLMMLLGLTDTVLDFRGRVAGRRGPPTPSI